MHYNLDDWVVIATSLGVSSLFMMMTASNLQHRPCCSTYIIPYAVSNHTHRVPVRSLRTFPQICSGRPQHAGSTADRIIKATVRYHNLQHTVRLWAKRKCLHVTPILSHDNNTFPRIAGNTHIQFSGIFFPATLQLSTPVYRRRFRPIGFRESHPGRRRLW